MGVLEKDTSEADNPTKITRPVSYNRLRFNLPLEIFEFNCFFFLAKSISKFSYHLWLLDMILLSSFASQ